MNEILEKLERENIKIASFYKRVLAYFIDSFLLSFVVVLVNLDAVLNAQDLMEQIALASSFATGFIVLQFFYNFVFTAFYGATLGKMACKIAVVDEMSLAKPDYLRCAVRAAGWLLSYMCFYLGFAWALGNDLRKTWEDYLAKTLVIEIA